MREKGLVGIENFIFIIINIVVVVVLFDQRGKEQLCYPFRSFSITAETTLSNIP